MCEAESFELDRQRERRRRPNPRPIPYRKARVAVPVAALCIRRPNFIHGRVNVDGASQ